jgi:hypothetical protein
MNQEHIQRDIRSAIGMAYELLRHEHVLNRDYIADALGNLESELFRIEAKLGGPRANEIVPADLRSRVTELEWLVEDAGEVIGAQIGALLGSVRRIERRLRRFLPSRQIPTRPLLGVLPVARVVPQDVHSAVDYAAALCCAAGSLLSTSGRARAFGAALGATLVGVSANTDARLSLTKVIPLEAHEAADYLLGGAAIVAPFALGYARKDRLATVLHVGLGIAKILTALVTDYRAAVGPRTRGA